jgi:hypothetical protein
MYQIRCFGYQEYKQLDCSHYRSRRHESTRFDPQNADAACRKCHNWVGETAEGKVWFEMFKRKQLGEQGYNLLMLRSETYKKRDDVMDKLYIRALLKEVL